MEAGHVMDKPECEGCLAVLSANEIVLSLENYDSLLCYDCMDAIDSAREARTE